MQVELCPENIKMAEMKSLSEESSFHTKLDNSVKRIVEKEGFINYKMNKRCVSTKGGNYLGELYEIDVIGTTETGDKELNLFIKNIVSEDGIKVVSMSGIYQTELFIYKELSKLYEELQEAANIPLQDRYKMAKIYEETDKETIIMENLAKKGFTTYHRMDVVSLKFLELCIENIARFHALSFVIKEKRPEYFNNKLKCLDHPIIFEEDYDKLLANISDIAIKNVNEDLREKLKKIYKNLVKKYSEYCKDEAIKVCLCHGDYRPTNVMMKLKNGEVEEVIAVDYQLNQYGCPVFDLHYLIYISTDRKFRKAHMENLKDLYYNTLDRFLKYFDFDAETVIPRKEFERVYKEKIDYGLFIAVQHLPLAFAVEDDVPDITQESGIYFSFKVDDGFEDRIRGVIEDFTELGYI